ncbi:MAG: hypothetical protein ACOCRO_00690 [Halanaerobiales bacterium]
MDTIYKISRSLKTPKTTDELYDQLHDEELNWKKEQLELYLKLNNEIKKESGKWTVGEASKEEKLLTFIQEQINKTPRGIIRVEQIINELPYELAFTAEQIINIVNNSKSLKAPNSKVITRK